MTPFRARLGALPRDVLLVAIRCYQLVFRPVLGPNCRFHPSCSDYAVEALRRHGAVRGAALASRRILRCNPWHPGGLDPVPVSCSCGDPHRRVLPIPIRD